MSLSMYVDVCAYVYVYLYLYLHSFMYMHRNRCCIRSRSLFCHPSRAVGLHCRCPGRQLEVGPASFAGLGPLRAAPCGAVSGDLAVVPHAP